MTQHIIDLCPHCGISKVAMDQCSSVGILADKYCWMILACGKCGKKVLGGHGDQTKKGTTEFDWLYPAGSFELSNQFEIPEGIRDDYREAGACLNIGCLKASMVMSRRALQRLLKVQSCNQRNLVEQINHALEKDILRKSFKEVATEIRQFGNLGAHPDDEELDKCTRENAQTILEFLKLLVEEFYEIPWKAKKLKENRK